MWATMSGTASAARARRTAADVDLPFVDGEALAAVDGGIGGDTIACAGARRAGVACDGATAFNSSSGQQQGDEDLYVEEHVWRELWCWGHCLLIITALL